ncbi:MAG: hypothetical protein R2705_10420 [Ilumatobacteraceae bacterium]
MPRRETPDALATAIRRGLADPELRARIDARPVDSGWWSAGVGSTAPSSPWTSTAGPRHAREHRELRKNGRLG